MDKTQEQFVLEVYHGIVVTQLLDNTKLKIAGNIVRGTPETDLIAPILARNLIYSWYNHQYLTRKVVQPKVVYEILEELPEKPIMKLPRPKGWQLMTGLVDDEGYTWDRGKIRITQPNTTEEDVEFPGVKVTDPKEGMSHNRPIHYKEPNPDEGGQ